MSIMNDTGSCSAADADHGPLKVMFLVTSMPVGGAETLLANLIRRLDPSAFAPELCCLKERGPLGDALAAEVPVSSGLLSSKYDVGVLGRLTRLLHTRHVDAIVTVGAGDKMFWGRLAAWRAGVPVVCCALHSTGWPDSIGFLNRRLTRLTDAFIGVAAPHGRHLVEIERLPAEKVEVIPNGVDTRRFAPLTDRLAIRDELEIPEASPVVGIVAALRPEKNHEMFLDAAALIRDSVAETCFVVVGDGPIRAALEARADRLGIADAVRFVGTREDIPQLLAAMDVFALTSHIEANPVSILESLAMEIPVVATDVGSVSETVRHAETGFLVPPGDATRFAARVVELLDDPVLRAQFGAAGRQHVVAHASLETMVDGYEQLIRRIYETKRGRSLATNTAAGDEPRSPLSSGSFGREIP